MAVAEGKVSLRREANDAAKSVIITKGQMSVLPEEGSPSAPQAVEVKKHLGWMHNEVLFEDTPLHEILFQLQRWYDVRFELADTSVAAERLTLHFDNKTNGVYRNIHSVAETKDFTQSRQDAKASVSLDFSLLKLCGSAPLREFLCDISPEGGLGNTAPNPTIVFSFFPQYSDLRNDEKDKSRSNTFSR